MSQQMADELPVQCHVIPHGVDMQLFRPMPTAVAKEIVGWREDARHVLFPYPTGRPEKDFPRAKRIVSAAADRMDRDVVLQSLQGTPHEAVPLYMNAADSMLLTSEYEGSPNTVKEAMACNLPVVSTDVGDVGERLVDVEPSVVARTDEALVDGLVEVLDAGVPSNGRQAVEPLGLESMAERIRAVYESVL
jgi:glycosyltransferase involved in cell wall biosynthesis